MQRIETMNGDSTTPVGTDVSQVNGARRDTSSSTTSTTKTSTGTPSSKSTLTPPQAAAEASSMNPINIPSDKFISSLVQACFDAIIDLFAYILARILNHPDVRDACSSAILEGMVKMCYDDNLHDHLKHVDDTLTQHQVSDAAKKGKDTQKIVKAYLGGIFANDDDDDDGEKEKEKKKKDV